MKNIVIIIIVLALAGIFGYAAMGPATLSVQRSMIIKASPEKIHSYINDFHKWPAWSPYEKMAPVAKRDYTGPASGKGSVYNWVSSNGWEGKMAIEESSPEKIVVLMASVKPMKAENTTEFLLNKKDKDSTEVIMYLHMDNSYVSKLLGIFMNRDKMMGAAFEDGLAKLKETVEKEATAAPAPKGKKK
jgi:hypothetical protein